MSSKVDALVLDIDGVLIDVENSYRRAIIDTLEVIYGDTISKATIQLFKNAGGFNNDWELTDAAALYLLACREGYDQSVDAYTDAIAAHGGGVEGAKTVLNNYLGTTAYEAVLCRWEPERIRRVFQQLYLGADLFEELENESPVANVPGYIHDEPVLIEEQTIATLQSRYPLGILTGRPETEAKIALDRAGLSIPTERQFTMDDWEAGKPAPDALMVLAERLGGSQIAFAGDTLDDIKTAKNAAAADPAHEYLAIGVLTGGLTGDQGRAAFIDAGADLVVDSINDLPNQLA